MQATEIEFLLWFDNGVIIMFINNKKLHFWILIPLIYCSICFATSDTKSSQQEALQNFFAIPVMDKVMGLSDNSFSKTIAKRISTGPLKGHENEVEKLVTKYVPIENRKQIILDTYAKYFTTEEITHLTTVYKDPVLQKVVELNFKIWSAIQTAEADLIKKNSTKINNELLEIVFLPIQQQAKIGSADAQYQLAHYYSEIVKDNKQGFYWTERAANNGNVWAMNDLALFYSHGIGVDKDRKKAVELYNRAANAGDEAAMFNLGLQYFYGDGVSKSYQTAFELFKKSAFHDDLYAKIMLAKCYFLGLGVKKDEAEGDNWLMLAAHNYYNHHFEDQVNIRDHYIKTFLSYEKSMFFGLTPKYEKGTTEDMIKRAEAFGKTIEKVCSISSYE